MDRKARLRIAPDPEPPKDYYQPVPEAEPNSHQRFEEEGNYATASATGESIRTLVQLIAACEIYTDIWQPLAPEFKAWNGYAKKERSDLHWKDGAIIDGYATKEGMETVQLYGISCRFVRKNPIPVTPLVSPVAAPETPELRFPKPKTRGIGRSLILCDPHVGFVRQDMARFQTVRPLHDRRVLDLTLQIAKAAKVDRLDILGDFGDWSEWTTRYTKSPEFYFLTQPAILEGYYWLKAFRETLPNATIELHQGNHDRRLENTMRDHLIYACDLHAADEIDLPPAMSVPRLLALHTLGIKWIGNYPDDDAWLNDRIRIRHGPTTRQPGKTAAAIAQSSDVLEIVGHIHRREWSGRTAWHRDGPRVIEAFCPGCACHIDGRVPGTKAKQQWQQGILIVDYETKGEAYHWDPVPIENGRALWGGKLYTAQSHQKALKKAIPNWDLGEDI
jgi:hypothetical protein